MFEYRVFTEDVFLLQNLVEDVDTEMDCHIQRGCDRVWYFTSKNVLILQAVESFEDGNQLLDELLLILSKHFTVEDPQFKAVDLFK